MCAAAAACVSPLQVCRKGQLLDPNQAALLRVFGVKMATFRITPLAWWSSEGEGGAGGGEGGVRGGQKKRLDWWGLGLPWWNSEGEGWNRTGGCWGVWGREI